MKIVFYIFYVILEVCYLVEKIVETVRYILKPVGKFKGKYVSLDNKLLTIVAFLS